MIEKIEAAYGTSSVHREALVKSIGYSSLSGASSEALSSLIGYGLLENTRKGESSVTSMAKEILFAESEDERLLALGKAALTPKVFGKIFEKFGRRAQTDGIILHLRNQGFTARAAESAAKSYLETMPFARLDSEFEKPDWDHNNREINTTVPYDASSSDVQTKRVEEFKDWIRLEVSPSVTVRIMTNGNRGLNVGELEHLMSVLELQLKLRKNAIADGPSLNSSTD